MHSTNQTHKCIHKSHIKTGPSALQALPLERIDHEPNPNTEVEDRIVRDLYPQRNSTICKTKEVSSYSRVSDTGLTLGSANVSVVHLGGELQAGQGLGEVRLQRADHDKHECLGVSAE